MDILFLLLENGIYLSISQASSIIGAFTKTLRHWHEKKLLIPDCRTIGGHRRYSVENLKNFTSQPLGNASGLNDKRPGLKRLIKDAFARKFTPMFITHKDRLARFGTTLLYQDLLLLDIDIVEKGTHFQAPQKDDTPAHA